MDEETLIEMFETARVIGLNGGEGEDQKYLVINQRGRDAELEFFDERPRTALVGGERDNWPKSYQVWQLIEEQETQ